MSKAITSPTVRPAVFEYGPRSSTIVPNTAKTRKKVVTASMRMPLARGDAVAERRDAAGAGVEQLRGQQEPQQEGAGDRAGHLGGDQRSGPARGHLAR